MPFRSVLRHLSSVVPKRSEGREVDLAKAGALCLLASTLLLLASCSSRPRDVDFIYINGPEPQSIDPAVLTGQPDGRISSSLFEGLTTRNARGEIIPGAAESWEHDGTHLVYTFHLRESSWSNGDPVTADDFAGSWRRILEPATACPYAEILFFIKGAEAFQKGELKDWSQVGIKVIDARTLAWNSRPDAFFPQVAAFVTYQPVHLPSVAKYGESWTRPGKIVCNGPYLLQDWIFNDRIELLRNETLLAKRFRPPPPGGCPLGHQIKYRPQPLPHRAGRSDHRQEPHSRRTDRETPPPPGFPRLHFFGQLLLPLQHHPEALQRSRVRQAFSAAIDANALSNASPRPGNSPRLPSSPPGCPATNPSRNFIRPRQSPPTIGCGRLPRAAKIFPV